MMRHYRNRVAGPEVELTALEETCVHCGRDLPIYQKDGRWVEGLETRFRLIYRDKKCSNSACPGPRPIVKATRDPRIVVPGRIYGTDVILHVGERHASDGVPLAQIARDLGARGLPLDQRHSCRLFRDYVALSNLVLDAEDARIKTLLRKQGGIVLMCDGVQFENRSAVLYLVWDAMSGTPLFGERKAKRGTEDLIPLLKRVRDLDVPVIGVVTDKETGLVPAIKSVFPDVPYQYCQQHFLNNCAKPLKPDLVALQASIDRRAEGVARIAKRLVMVSAGGNDVASAAGQQSGPVASTVAALSEPGAAPQLPPAASTITPMGEPAASQQFIPSEPTLLPMSEPEVGNQPLGPAGVPVPPADEHEVVTAFCELVRANSRVSGKAPFDPAELKRHERLEQIRETVHKVKKNSPSWRLLAALDDALTPKWHEARVAGRVGRHTTIIREVAHLLSPNREDRPTTADAAYAQYDKYLMDLVDSTPRAGLGAKTGDFIDDLIRRSTRYGAHLFTCFDDARIPRTTNELERFFGSSKRQLRQALGCGSTMNSVVTNLGADALLTYHHAQRSTAATHLETNSFSPASFNAARRALDRAEHPAIRRRSQVRNLPRHLASLNAMCSNQHHTLGHEA